MSEPGTPTIDQLQVFLAVVETGSLAAAGRKLNRATSAISYAIDHLEAGLGIALFDRETTRKPQLSEAGRAVLVEARALSRGLDSLRAKVKGLAGGLGGGSLAGRRRDAADSGSSSRCCKRSSRLSRPCRSASTSSRSAPSAQHVLDGVATLGICGPFRLESDRLEYIPFRDLELIPVAAPTHPLASGADTGIGAARRHVQLVLTDRSTLTAGQDFGVFADQTWRLGDLGAKHALLLAGIGWGQHARGDGARGPGGGAPRDA